MIYPPPQFPASFDPTGPRFAARQYDSHSWCILRAYIAVRDVLERVVLCVVADEPYLQLGLQSVLSMLL